MVGSSGSGKSTLVHLIPRFFDVTQGRLLIDGLDVRDVTLGFPAFAGRNRHPGNSAIQRHRAQQHRLRTAHISHERSEAAARAAFAHDFIMDARRIR